MEPFNVDMKDTPEERAEKIKIKCFQAFLDEPLTRLTLSSSFSPEVAKGEALRLLLSAAFDAAFGAGRAASMADMAAGVVQAMEHQRKNQG